MAKPDDRRDFVRVATDLPDHPKLADIDSPQAAWLYVVGLCWAGKHLTDGHVVARTAERKAHVTARWSKELIRVGLWHMPGHDCPDCPQPAPGSVYIHDYLCHQRSRAAAEDLRGARAEAGRRGADSRWSGRQKVSAARQVPPPHDGNSHGSGYSNSHSKPDGKLDGNTDGKLDGKPIAEVEVEVEKTPTGSSPGHLSSSSHLPEREAKTATTTKPDGPPSDWLIERGTGRLPAADLAIEAAAFRAVNAGRWDDIHDVRRAWSGWLRIAQDRNKPTPTPSRPSCPLHPEQPTGSKACPDCTAEAVPPPSLRKLRTDLKDAPS